MIYWITGRPGAGKTTFSKRLKDIIDHQSGYKKCILLDGDDIRSRFETGFTIKDRKQHLIRAIEFAKLLEDQGFIPICAFVSPTTELREFVRSLANEFTLVYIDREGNPLWPGTTYESPIEEENAMSPDDVINSIINKK